MVEMMNSVLSTAKANIKNLARYKKVLVVLGNETCDLDSAISSLVYSLLLHHFKIPDFIVVPVFNITSKELPVKTEVSYALKKFNVDLNNIVCRNEIDLLSIQRTKCLELTLVDHHALQSKDQVLASSVVAVIDHRPQDEDWPWAGSDFILRVVGSCCSLVAEKLLSKAPQLITPTVATMLLGTILLDTACLAVEAGRATPLDHEIANKLQTIIGRSVDRMQLFSELREAKSDIASLTSAQLLIKDLKVAGGIPIAGLPISVKEFLRRPDASDALVKFCKECNTTDCVVYGSDVIGGTIYRDLAVYSTNNSVLSQEIVIALTNSVDPAFGLEPKPCNLTGLQLFQQTNIKHTRKQILPIILKVGNKLKNSYLL